ncbi:MAG: YbhN family protein [Rubrobacteraceae bacterium]
MEFLRTLRKRTILRHVLFLVSIGLAVHLILPEITGIERSAQLVTRAAPALILAAFLAELASQLCYAELIGRAVGAASWVGTTIQRRRRGGLGRWFMLRLAVSETGASRVLPGGGASMAAVTYTALRKRDFRPEKIGLALAMIATLIYGALGTIFAGSVFYMILHRDLGPAGLLAALGGLVLTLVIFAGSYAAYRRPKPVGDLLARLFRGVASVIPGRRYGPAAENLAERIVTNVRNEIRAARRQLGARPSEAFKLAALAFGYWGFDALCLILVFRALGIPAGTLELLVAYGLATALAAFPITPGGIGVFETAMISLLALLGVGTGAAVAVLGYRLFNFWLPIPLAAIFYPTLHWRFGRRKRKSGGH